MENNVNSIPLSCKILEVMTELSLLFCENKNKNSAINQKRKRYPVQSANLPVWYINKGVDKDVGS